MDVSAFWQNWPTVPLFPKYSAKNLTVRCRSNSDSMLLALSLFECAWLVDFHIFANWVELRPVSYSLRCCVPVATLLDVVLIILRCRLWSALNKLSRITTKPTKWLYAQRRLRSASASAQSDQSSLCAQRVAKDPSFLPADSEDSDQTGQMPKLIWVFAGRTVNLLVLSWGGSIVWSNPRFACMRQISLVVCAYFIVNTLVHMLFLKMCPNSAVHIMESLKYFVFLSFSFRFDIFIFIQKAVKLSFVCKNHSETWF